MRRLYLIAAALAVCLAGCSDKPGPVAVETAPVQRRDLLGTWGGSSADKAVEINFDEGRPITFDSLFLAVSFMDNGYSLLVRCDYEGGQINYSESGDWVCDQRNPGHLTFNIRSGHFYRYNFNGFILNVDSISDRASPYISWGSEFEYNAGKIKDLKYREATLRLFNISGMLDIGELMLLKR